MSASGKLERTLQRVQEKIEEKSFYEAHQAILTVANRYRKQKNYNDAIDVLYHGSQKLQKVKEYSSASDLTFYLLEIFKEAAIPVDNDSKSKIVELIAKFPGDEPTMKKLGAAAVSWSAQFGSCEYGDPSIQYAVGMKLLEGNDAYNAEKFLFSGTIEGIESYAEYLFEWYKEDENPNTAGLYLSRAVLPLLSASNIRFAWRATEVFLAKLNGATDFEKEAISTQNHTSFIYSKLELINFLQLLLLSAEKKSSEMYNRLVSRYSSVLSEHDFLQIGTGKIGEVIFGVYPQKQNNVLQDLMSNLFAAQS